MAASLTHLVVGERVFKRIPHFTQALPVYGSFLAGCILVDVHASHDIDRRVTHFVGRVEEDGEAAYRESCSNFLGQLDSLLFPPWKDLVETDRAFVTGYLCHLAADECWKELGWQLFQQLGITSWADFPIPGDVSLTAFDFLSRQTMTDFHMACSALQAASIPDVFRHVPEGMFRHQWEVIREYVRHGATPESHIEMLVRAGKPEAEIEGGRRRHIDSWQAGLDFVHKTGGVTPFLENAVWRTVEVLPALWLDG